MTNTEAVPFVSKWAKKTANRILSGELSEAEINKMRSLLASAINHPNVRAHCTPNEAWEIVCLLQKHPVRVSAEQARKGAQWLYNVTFTPKGERRQSAQSECFRDYDAQVIRDLAAAESPEFWLTDLEEVTPVTGWTQFLPVYCAVGKSGRFSYSVGSWQSGGGVRVISHA